MSNMSNPAGYFGKILWVDLKNRRSNLEERDDVFWRRYAGGGLVATKLLLEKTRPGIDPLSEENLLIFASSVIAGHRGAGLARFTTAAKSPMTNGIGEAHTEGPWGIAMKACGADILVFTGKSAEPVTVSIQDGKVEFHDAKTLWGKTVGETTDELERHMGTTIHVAAIGPAGENLVRFASVVSDRSAIRDLRTWLGLRYQRRLATHIEPLAHPWDPGKDPYGVYWPWQDQKL